MPSPSTLAKGKLGVWIAEGGKLFLYDKNTRSVKPMYAEVHLQDTGPTMVEGSEGNLWVALKDGGVMRVDTCGSMSLYLPEMCIRDSNGTVQRNRSLRCFGPCTLWS